MAFEPIEEYADPYKEPRLELNPEISKGFSKVCCPSCDSEIAADDLNIHDKIGKCCDCNVIFPFDKTVLSLESTPQKIRQEILRPEGIDLFYFDEALEISIQQPYPWIEYVLIGIMLFVGLVSAVGIAEGAVSAMVLFIGLILSSVFYYFHRKKKHKVYITIDEQNLNIYWQPKKLKKDKTYSSKGIAQLYVKHNPNIGIWNIMMIVNEDGGHKHIKLTSTSTVSKAKFLEQEIERHLKIQDVDVPEETK